MNNNCTECPHHEIQSDPDPEDWFCDDDVKVYCKVAKKHATTGCRPYNAKKETAPVPTWCPLKKKKIIVKGAI